MSAPKDRTFWRIAEQLGFLTPAQIEDADRRRAELPSAPPLETWLVAEGLLLPEQTEAVRRALDALASGATLDATPPPLPSDFRTHAALPDTESVRASTPLAGCLGKYELLELLGQGGMGMVYRARDTELDREVALKTLLLGAAPDAEIVERLLREARTAAALDHPAVVPIYDVGLIDGVPYFVMGFVRGRTLDEALARKQFPEMRRRVQLVAEIAQGVAYAHEQKVVHRDLKPSNILLDERDRVHILDFGLAKRDADGPRLTATGQMLGTPEYMPPEQIEGRLNQVGPASDVYALGALLYEILTGKPPFTGASVAEIISKSLRRDPIRPRRRDSRIAQDLETICLKSLEKDPARRYPNAGAFAIDLERFLNGEAIAARPVSMLRRVWRRAAKHRAVIGTAVGVATVAAAISLGALLSNREETRLARDDAVRAREDLRKAGLVQDVLVRWGGLTATLQKMEAIHHDSTLDLAALRRGCALLGRDVEEFVLRTDPDPAAQSAMRALAGWARRVAGFEDEGIAWMRQARQLDPSLPYGALMEALCRLSDYLEMQPLPPIVITPLGMDFRDIPPEIPEMRELRARIDALLAEADRARISGKGGAEEFRLVLQAIRDLQAARYADAEAGFTRALAAAALQPFRSELAFARAKVRYLQKHFTESAQDLAMLIELRPRQAELRFLLAQIHCGEAFEASARGGDPRAGLERAIAGYGEAIKLTPLEVALYSNRATAWRSLGAAEAAHGNDPLPSYVKAIDDYAEAHRLDPQEVTCRIGRGNTHLAIAQYEGSHERDPRTSLTAAIAEFDAAIAIVPTTVVGNLARGETHVALAHEEEKGGRDPDPEYNLATADLGRALFTDSRYPSAYYQCGMAWLLKADAQARAGRETAPALERALAHLTIARDRIPVDHSLHGVVVQFLGMTLEMLRRAPEARAAYEECLRLHPENKDLQAGMERVKAALSAPAPETPAWIATVISALAAARKSAPAEARKLLEDALHAAGPDDAEGRVERIQAHLALAEVYAQLAGGSGGGPPANAAEYRTLAYAQLQRLGELGFRDPYAIAADGKFVTLHADPRWVPMLEAMGLK